MEETFLKDLGLSEEVIPKILTEHSKELEAKASQLQAESEKLKAANQTIRDLREAAKAFDGVDVKKLQEDMAALQEKYDQDIAAMKLDNAVELALSGAKAKNNKAVKAMLDMEQVKLGEDGKLSGFEEQLAALKKSDAYLFDDGQASPPQFTGFQPGASSGSPNPAAAGYESRISDARKNHNQLEVIKIKQEAAKAGVVLM